MGWIHFLLITLTAFLSPNSTATVTADTNRVVTQIDIPVMQDNPVTTTTYTDDRQMESILTYLRVTDPTAARQFEPDSFRSVSYTFTVHFSDGSQNIYRQIYHDYLQKNDGRWQRIGPKADLLFPPL